MDLSKEKREKIASCLETDLVSVSCPVTVSKTSFFHPSWRVCVSHKDSPAGGKGARSHRLLSPLPSALYYGMCLRHWALKSPSIHVEPSLKRITCFSCPPKMFFKAMLVQIGEWCPLCLLHLGPSSSCSDKGSTCFASRRARSGGKRSVGSHIHCHPAFLHFHHWETLSLKYFFLNLSFKSFTTKTL